jgi:hypothetical protein
MPCDCARQERGKEALARCFDFGDSRGFHSGTDQLNFHFWNLLYVVGFAFF